MNYLYIEWLALKQHFYFSMRNKRYFIIAFFQYLYSLKSPRKSFQLRLVYCTLQLIDDIIDGDRNFEYDKKTFIQNLIDKKYQTIPDHELKKLYQYTYNQFDKTFTNKEEIKLKFDRLIYTMLFDLDRVDKKIILPMSELLNQHYKTFEDSMDVVLIALDSPLRTNNVPAILEIFAWCSTIRDLEEDLDKGLVNIPTEVVSKIKNFDQLKTNEQVANNEIKNFISDWNAKIKTLYPIAYLEYSEIKKQNGSFMFKMFLDSMKKYLPNEQ